MIIDLRTIPREGARTFKFSMDRDCWRPKGVNERVMDLNSPLIVNARIFRTGDKYVLDGDLEGSIQVMCDRCLEYYQRDVRTDFRLFLVRSPDREKAEIELLEEDMEVDFIRDEEIDLDEIIQEQLYLSLPIKSLCMEECLGLCPICGHNLNNGACQCKREQARPDLSKF
jgi:uncharacterized protein